MIGRHLSILCRVLSVSALAMLSSVAMTQVNPPAPLTPLDTPETKTNSGILQSPKPYGDRGTTGAIGHKPIAFPDPHAPRPDPYSYWKRQIINTGSGVGCGTVVIVIGGSPCYVPTYYGYGFGGYWMDSSAYANFRLGGLGFGFNQQQYTLNSGISSYQVPYPQVEYGRPSTLRERSAANAERMNAQRERRNQEAREKARAEDDDYYLYRKAKPKTALDNDPALAEAVADIEAAFRTGDISRLERHVTASDTLTLMAKGKTRTPMSGASYLDMTRAAFKEMKTIRYQLDKVEPASNGAWLVYGTHILRTEDGKEKSFTVGFVLKKRGNAWAISEVSADVASQ